jgi:type IV fimbrial biogenesis protein FimT
MKQNGFTLVELMVTIALAAILMMVAVPGMRSFIISSSVDKKANDTLNALYSARSHAIDINRDVVVCFADANNACTKDSATHFMIFVDKDSNGAYDPTASDKDILLTQGDTFDSNSTVASTRASYRFTSDGLLRGDTDTLTFYNHDDSCVAKKIVLATSGRAKLCSSSDAGNGDCPSGSYCP